MKHRLSTFFLNLIFYPLFFCVSGLLIPILSLVVAIQAPFISHRKAMQRFHNLIKVYGKAVIVCAYPWIKVRCENNAGDCERPSIFVINHRSATDPFLMAFLPGELIQVVNSWPFKLPVLGFFARAAGYLGVNDMPVEEFFALAQKELSQGVHLIGFPEGTRAVTHEMGPFHSSLFRLAKEVRAPIVPVCMSGSGRVMPKGSPYLHPSRVNIRLLPAVQPSDFEEMSPFQLKQHVRNLIQTELREMDGAQP